MKSRLFGPQKNGDLTIARELVTLKRGEKRIVFNAECVNPIYFPRGGDEAVSILKKLKEIGPVSNATERICPPGLFRLFVDHSLLVQDTPFRHESSCECEQRRTETLQSPGRSLYLLLSQSCNQKCIYCLNGRNTYRTAGRLMMTSRNAFKTIETVFKTISPGGRLEIVFFGGEPLLNWQLAKDIIQYCEGKLKTKTPEKKIAYHLTTNLTIFPDDLIETARKHNITFLVNIDGPDDIHDRTRPFRNGRGSFHTTAKNIRRLTNAGFEINLRATITSHNHHRMAEVAETHKSLGGAGCAFVPLNAIDSDESALPYGLCPSPEEFARGLRKVYRSGLWPVERLFPYNEYLGRLKPNTWLNWGCGAPFGNTPVVNTSGEMFSCIYLVGIKRFKLGDIHKGDFPKQEVVRNMLDIVDVNKREKCMRCGIRYLCGGGCPVSRFTVAGNQNVPYEIKRYTEKIACVTSKTVLSELLWDMGKRALEERGIYERQR